MPMRIKIKKLEEKYKMIQEKKQKYEKYDKEKPGLRLVPTEVRDECYFKALMEATRKKRA